MSADIQLFIGDIQIANGDLVMAYDDAALIQRLRTRLQDIKGDWFRDLDRGTDWYGAILGKRSRLARRAEFRRVILGTEGVSSVISLTFDYDGATRTLAVEFTALKTDGLQLDVRFDDVLAGGN